MSNDVTQGAALALMLLALPLISLGAWNEIAALWWLGLGVLVLGGLIPPVTRYVGGDDDEDDDGADEEDDP